MKQLESFLLRQDKPHLSKIANISRVHVSGQEAVLAISQFVLAGDLFSSEVLFKRHRHDLSLYEQVVARYFLGLGYCLYDELSKAKLQVIAVLQLVLEQRSKTQAAMVQNAIPPEQWELEAYAHLLAATYHYFVGRLNLAQNHVNQALRKSRQTSLIYCLLQCYEAQIQIYVSQDQYKEAIQSIQAYLHERTHHHVPIKPEKHSQLQFMMELYQAKLTTNMRERLRLLKALHDIAQVGFFFSLSILLEISRTQVLLAQINDARQNIQKAKRLLSKKPNRRFLVHLYLRYADLNIASHLDDEAQAFLELAKTKLLKDADLTYRYEITQRLQQISVRNQSPDAPALAQELSKLRRLIGATIPNRSVSPHIAMKFAKSLNFRQIKILEWLQQESFIDVQQVKIRFLVSEITACRDLSELTKQGLIKRVGKARATRYTKNII